MEGKLLKYASGLSNTHAWKNAMDLTGLTPFLLDAGVPEPEAAKAVSCPSVREAMGGLGNGAAHGYLKRDVGEGHRKTSGNGRPLWMSK
jgi:cobalamin biosynthesis protein CbiD